MTQGRKATAISQQIGHICNGPATVIQRSALRCSDLECRRRAHREYARRYRRLSCSRCGAPYTDLEEGKRRRCLICFPIQPERETGFS